MCGRFLLDTDIEEIARTYGVYKREIKEFDRGDVYPTKDVPILVENNDRTIILANWGFPYINKKGVVINARAETIMEKPMFKDSFYNGRCIIPANLFYEWKDEGDKKKIRHKISLQSNPLMSLAGIYKITIDENSNERLMFVIITTEANENMKSIHSRMPLIIKDDMVGVWLKKNTPTEELKKILKRNMDDSLIIERCEDRDYQQLSMF
ncbi:SOS response-associated peptidase [Tepidimicrobium xylanilyticum]|nr:SOS response-associated peptidase [Tepidimicrobium xylanilyticum]GMG96391.1 DUF159 family protein [Tepidimicrobium xylanilyticum]